MTGIHVDRIERSWKQRLMEVRSIRSCNLSIGGRRILLEYKESGHRGPTPVVPIWQVIAPGSDIVYTYTKVRKKIPISKVTAEPACLIAILRGVLVPSTGSQETLVYYASRLKR
jgi:hypothetical protein